MDSTLCIVCCNKNVARLVHRGVRLRNVLWKIVSLRRHTNFVEKLQDIQHVFAI